ncbi:MAG: tetratricopeptide repeat protein [Pyrinomonadaceae bacterium]
MPKHILFGILGLFAGLIIGFFGANKLNDNAKSANNLPVAETNAPFNPQIHSADIKETTPNSAIPDVQKVLDKAKNEPDNAQAQIEAGDMYSKIGKFAEAAAFYETANKTNPNDFQSNLKLANAYFDSDQFIKAGEFYEKALQINPNDVGARTDLGITFVERENPDFDRAIKEFETSLKADPKHEPTLYNLSVAYFKKGDIEKSQNALKQLEEANPNSKLIERLKQTIGKI